MMTFCNCLFTAGGRNMQMRAIMKPFERNAHLQQAECLQPGPLLVCKRKHSTKKARKEEKLKRARKAKGSLLRLWRCCYHLFSPQLSKEALKETCTDSSQRLKGATERSCVCVTAGLFKQKPQGWAGRFWDDYAKALLVCRHQLKRHTLCGKGLTSIYWC